MNVLLKILCCELIGKSSSKSPPKQISQADDDEKTLVFVHEKEAKWNVLSRNLDRTKTLNS